MKTWRINQFHGGNAIDEKLGLTNQFADTSKGIDLYYKPSILRGNLKMETVETGAVSARMQDFIKGSDGTTYGYGYIAYGGANTWMRLWKLSGTTWSAAGSATSSIPIEDGQVIEYKDYLYFYTQTNKIGRYGTLSSSPSFTESWQTTTNSITKHGPMAIQKNTLYIANGNNVASWDGTTWTASTNFDLPSGWTIVSLIAWGKYLVAGATSPEDDKVSRMFFWETSATSWEFAKDIPYGKLVGIRNIGDVIKGIVVDSASDADHIGSLNIIEWTGGVVKVVWTQKLEGMAAVANAFRNNGLDSKGGVLYLGGVLDTTNNIGGIWTWGQPIPGGRFAFNRAIVPPSTTLQMFHCLRWIGTFLYASIYDNTSTDYRIIRTDDTTDVYEDIQYDSLIFDGDNPHITKEIKRIILNTKDLPANGVITLQYKTDRGSWATIGTMTDGKQQSFTSIDGVAFNQFNELQLQLTTNMTTGEGLIEITDITTLYEELDIKA